MSGTASGPVMALVTGIAEYQLRVVSGMAESLAARGIPLIVATNEPFASEGTPSVVLDLIRRRVPRGVVALADTSEFRRPELAAALAEAEMPTVTLGAKFAGAPRVVGDNEMGMRELMHHLLDERHRRRLVLVRGRPDHIDSTSRELVFREELAARGLTVDEGLIVDGMFRPNASYEGLRKLMEHRDDFDAVIALNDPSAFGALAALTDQGLRVPQDVLLSGWDNTDGSSMCWPALTTVDQNLEEQGRVAVELLLRRCAGGSTEDDVLVRSRLVVRASTGHKDGAPAEAPPASTTRALQARVALQDAALNLSWTTANCRTMNDLVRELEACLSRLRVPRFFLVLDHVPRDGRREPLPPPGHASNLLLSYRDDRTGPPSHDVFPRHQLLPATLRPELERGVLMLQSLSIAGRERGYLLYEPVLDSYLITEAIRVDLPRTIDMILSTQEMADHAANLERLVAQRTEELERANHELQGFVMRDGLTGISNRMAFQKCLDDFCGDLSGGPRPGADDDLPGRDLAVLMIDVDMFKAFNDRYGHLDGDETLRTVAACLLRAVREPQDIACRYGGEEFAVILRDTKVRGAVSVAKRFQRLLARTAIRHETSPVAPVVTVSIGVAGTRVLPGTSPTGVVAAADEALYEAKMSGRNRIVVSARGHEVRVPA